MTPRIYAGVGSFCGAIGLLAAVATLATQGTTVVLMLPYIAFSAVCVVRFETLTGAQKTAVMTTCLGVSAMTLQTFARRWSDPASEWLGLTTLVLGPSLPFVLAAWLSHRFPKADPYAGIPGPSKTLNALLYSKRLRAAAVLGVRKPSAWRDSLDEPMF